MPKKKMFNQPCLDRYGNDQCHLRRFNLEDAPSRRTIPGIRPTPSSRPAIPPRPSIPDRPRVAVTYVPAIPQPERERTAQVVSGRIKPAIKTTPMTSEEFNAAAMSRAAYIQFQEGERATMRYTKQNVKGWQYDPELSNEMAVVFSRGDEAAIAYRGTQESPGFNKDWEANFRNRLGLDRMLKATPQEAIIAEQLKMVRAKYSGGIALTTGHSRGGAEALKTCCRNLVRCRYKRLARFRCRKEGDGRPKEGTQIC